MTSNTNDTGSLLFTRFAKLAALLLFAGMLARPHAEGINPSAHRLAAVTVLMAVLWLTQAIPIAATSLLPLVLFPLLGIQTAHEVSKSYINEQVFLFLGGFIIALGIEKSGLHRRLALSIVRLIGGSPRLIVLGFMLATAALSMWISNTASALLMFPIGLAMLSSLNEMLPNTENEPAATGPLSVALMLGIAYAASIGGMTTLVGTPTNVAFVGIWNTQFPEAPQISAGQWMMVFVPVGVVFLLLAWKVLTFGLPALPGSERIGRAFFTDRLRKLGKPGRGEIRMLLVLVTASILWIFRQPLQIGQTPIVSGWGTLVERWLTVRLGTDQEFAQRAVDDSTVAIGMALLMFVVPAERDQRGRVQYLMDWKTAERLPWGILLLIGGGFAIADAFSDTGLSTWIGNSFASEARGWSQLWLVAGVCLLMTFLTEFTSNVATVNAVLPILAAGSVSLGVDPRLLMIPAAVSTSCAFMLPIATPPNAIVFGTGRITMPQMMKYGLILNLVGVVLISAATFGFLVPQFGLLTDSLPQWANPAP